MTNQRNPRSGHSNQQGGQHQGQPQGGHQGGGGQRPPQQGQGHGQQGPPPGQGQGGQHQQQPGQGQYNQQQQQYQDQYYEEEYYEEPPEEEEEEGETSLEMWLSIFGSSALFHVLLLALLAMLIISNQEEKQKEVEVMRAPKKKKIDFKKEKKKHKVESPVKKKKTVKNPKVAEKQSDHNEEDVNKKFNEDQGESKDFKSDANLQSKSFNATIGLGGGAGGDFGKGRGGNENLGALGGSGATQNAVLDALIWLAKHQSSDGHWDVYGYTNQCEGTVCEKLVSKDHTDYNVGVTGLALLAFLGAGYTHKDTDVVHEGRNFGKVVKKALFWLKEQQNADGAFSTGGSKPMYNNSLAALAYAEAYGMTGAPMLRDIAQRGVDYVQKAQNEAPSGTGFLGWRYEPNSGDNDTSVTGWAAMAIKSGEIAGLDVAGASMDGALNWVEKVTNSDYWLVGYRDVSDAGKKVAAPGKNENYKNHPSMTAIGMLVRMFANKDPNSEPVKGGAKAIMADLPEWKDADPDTQDHPVDYYYWYYASLALYMYAGPDSPNEGNGMWSKWNSAMKKAVVGSQEGSKDGHEKGSWDPISRWSWEAGRVYATALNALTLEVYYRYNNAFMVGSGSDKE